MIYLIDSNILIGIVTRRRPYDALLDSFLQGGNVLATCSIVVSEMYAGMRSVEEARTARLLESLEFLPVTYSIARLAGRLRNDAAKRGRILTLADTTVAAVAIFNRCVLVSENAKDFSIDGLQLLVPLANKPN